MKILILSDTFPPHGQGGAETVAYRLAKEYANKGHQIVVITTIREKKLSGKFKQGNLVIYRLFTNLPFKLRAYWGIINWQVVSKIKQIIKEEKPQITHAHNVHSGLSYYSLRIIKKIGIPIILTVHDAMPFCYRKFVCYLNEKDLSDMPQVDYKKKTLKCFSCQKFRYFPLRNILIRYIFRKYVDEVLAVSKAHFELLKVNKIPVNNFIYNGLAPEKFNVNQIAIDLFLKKFDLQYKKIILLVGRPHSGKGGKYLLEALLEIVRKIPQTKLLILSKRGGYADFLLKYAKELNLASNVVIITGWLKGEELKTCYQVCDLVVVPSVCFETFGLVNLEAMVYKKPVIGTCFGGVSEVIENNVTGFIVNPFNTKELAEKIIDLLTNPEKAKVFGEKGYERLKEKFLIKYQVEHCLKLMEELIKSGAKHLSSE